MKKLLSTLILAGFATAGIAQTSNAGAPITKSGEVGMTQKQELNLNKANEKSRAEVKSDLKASKNDPAQKPKNGEIGMTQKEELKLNKANEKSRAEVKNEVEAAKRTDQLPKAGEMTPPSPDVNKKTEGNK